MRTGGAGNGKLGAICGGRGTWTWDGRGGRGAHGPPDPAQGKEGTPTRGGGATPTEGGAEPTAAEPTTKPSPPSHDPGCSKGHHTGNGTGTRRGRGHGRDTQD